MTTHWCIWKGQKYFILFFFFASVSTGKACFRFQCTSILSEGKELPAVGEKWVRNTRVQSSEVTLQPWGCTGLVHKCCPMWQYCVPLPVTAVASRSSLTAGLRLLCPSLTEVKRRIRGTVGSSNFPQSPKQSWSTRRTCFWNPSLVHKGKDYDEQPAESHEGKSCLPKVVAF